MIVADGLGLGFEFWSGDIHNTGKLQLLAHPSSFQSPGQQSFFCLTGGPLLWAFPSRS